jgi:hypothetical protein
MGRRVAIVLREAGYRLGADGSPIPTQLLLARIDKTV